MSRRLDDHGSETFWPGYVDAVTNLVLNLLFVVVIMTVAVFMFALELGRRQPIQTEEGIPSTVPVPGTMPAHSEEPEEVGKSLRRQLSVLETQVQTLREKEAQIQSLQSKLQTLEKEAKQQPQSPRQAPETTPSPQDPQKTGTDGVLSATPAGASGGSLTEVPKVIMATAPARPPERGLEKVVPTGATGGIVVKFAEDAIALSRTETEDLRKALGPVVAGSGVKVEVVVPTGFSEARRLGFYRAMAVRNQLIEMKVPAARIEISVRDGSVSADSSRVMVSPR